MAAPRGGGPLPLHLAAGAPPPPPPPPSERAALLAELAALQRDSVRVSILTHVAIENSVRVVRTDTLRPTVNRPSTAAFRASGKPLVSRHRRAIGTPFFADGSGGTPPRHPDGVLVERLLAGLPPAGEHRGRFTPADDGALVDAVYRVARMALLEGVFARAGLPLPESWRPLGSESAPTLRAPGPRAESQFDDRLLAPGAVAPALLAQLGPSGSPARAAFDAELGAALGATRAQVLAAAGAPAQIRRAHV